MISSIQLIYLEHWSVNNIFGLDAKNSDYIYKHHLTRLEDIYVRHKFQVSDPPKIYVLSPLTQLYGVDGLESNLPGKRLKQKARESKWVDNFTKYSALSDSFNIANVKRPNSTNGLQDSQNFSKIHQNHDEIGFEEDSIVQDMLPNDTTKPKVLSSSRRARQEKLSHQELIMLGLYKFNPQQEEIYNKFIEMLSEFDAYDMVSFNVLFYSPNSKI